MKLELIFDELRTIERLFEYVHQSNAVLRLYDFGSQGCRFEPRRVQTMNTNDWCDARSHRIGSLAKWAELPVCRVQSHHGLCFSVPEPLEQRP
jgi:hypothetical protein